MEADFTREYRIDLTAAVEDGMTTRRFGLLVGGLSPRAVFRLATHDDPAWNDDPASALTEWRAWTGGRTRRRRGGGDRQ